METCPAEWSQQVGKIVGTILLVFGFHAFPISWRRALGLSEEADDRHHSCTQSGQALRSALKGTRVRSASIPGGKDSPAKELGRSVSIGEIESEGLAHLSSSERSESPGASRAVSDVASDARSDSSCTTLEGQSLEALPIQGLLQSLELNVQVLARRYQRGCVTTPRSNMVQEELDRADMTLKRVQQRLREVERFRGKHPPRGKRSLTFHGGCDLAQAWGQVYGHVHPSFRDVARKVRLGNRVIGHWRLATEESAKRCFLERNLTQESLKCIDTWDGMDPFQEEKEHGQPLVKVFMTIWTRRKMKNLSSNDDKKVHDFAEAVEERYRKNRYHNSIHAADVTLAVHSWVTQVCENTDTREFFTGVDMLVSLVASAIHDIDHPAVNNDFLIKSRDPLALRYNDTSVLENYHCATAFELMQRLGVDMLKHKLPSPASAALRARVINMVIGTDMQHHQDIIDSLAAELSKEDNMQDIDKVVLEKNILHMADISHPLRPWQQHVDWSKRCTDEFLSQGDREKALGLPSLPLFDREKAPPLAKGQVGFIRFVVNPGWTTLYRILGPDADLPNQNLKDNLSEWERLAEQEEQQEAEAKALEATPEAAKGAHQPS